MENLKNLKKAKKSDLTEYIEKLRLELDEREKRLSIAEEDLAASQETCKEIFRSQESMEETLKEYRDLLQEVKDKYEKASASGLIRESIIRGLTVKIKVLSYSLIISLGLLMISIITLIFI